MVMMLVYRKIRKKMHKVLNRFKKKVPVYIPVLYGELLRGRTALVTGGTSGIGYSIAEAFIRNGAGVIITGRNQEKIDCAVDGLRKLLPSAFVLGIVMDNTDIKSLESGFTRLKTDLVGRTLDILVNNAGVLNSRTFRVITESDYDYVMDTNLKGTFFLSKLACNYMVENKIHGNILNVASSSSLRPAISPYTLSKWGLRGLTMGLAKTMIAHDIVVNGLAPGPTATPMLAREGIDDITRNASPNARFSLPEEMANLAVILCSELGRTVVGDIVYATGGCGVLTLDDVGYEI